MPRRPARVTPLAVSLAALLAAATLVAACGEPGVTEPPPPPLPSVDIAPEITPGTDIPLFDVPLPNGDTDLMQVLLENAGGEFDAYRSVGRLEGASLACTLVLVDAAPGVETGPAYALTNGHCLGLNGNETMVDRALEGTTAVFDYFADTPERLVVPVARVAWASMKGTDLAVLELDESLVDLVDAGYRAWPMAAVEPEDVTRDVAIVGAPVGVPLVDIPEDQRYLRAGTCSLDTEPVLVNERLWLWEALRNDCPEVLPGNSGSPLFDIDTGALVGLVNTTTYKGEAGAPCWLGRPCEVTEDGEDPLPDTSYAMPLDILDGCFGADGTFGLGGACGLDPGDGVELSGEPIAVNPSVADPVSGERRTTWATTVGTADDGYTHYRAKIGPLATTDCADAAGYGAPVPVATPIDDELPTDEQRLLLCVVGGRSEALDGEWQAFAHATFAVAYVDTTPPVADIEFAVSGDASDGWLVEPVYVPPELSLYIQKGGPARSTDCADRGGYRIYRRIPLTVDAADAPFRYCAIGFDDAGNASAPKGVVLE